MDYEETKKEIERIGAVCYWNQHNHMTIDWYFDSNGEYHNPHRNLKHSVYDAKSLFPNEIKPKRTNAI